VHTGSLSGSMRKGVGQDAGMTILIYAIPSSETRLLQVVVVVSDYLLYSVSLNGRHDAWLVERVKFSHWSSLMMLTSNEHVCKTYSQREKHTGRSSNTPLLYKRERLCYPSPNRQDWESLFHLLDSRREDTELRTTDSSTGCDNDRLVNPPSPLLEKVTLLQHSYSLGDDNLLSKQQTFFDRCLLVKRRTIQCNVDLLLFSMFLNKVKTIFKRDRRIRRDTINTQLQQLTNNYK